MDTNFFITRNLIVGLLLVYVSVVFLHVSHLPVWTFALFTFTVLWRVNILREKWPSPRRVLRTLLVVLSFTLLFIDYQNLAAVEPMVSLLLLAFTLKLLEIRYYRDFLVLIFLSYFVIASSFLFDQSVLHTFFGVVSTVITTVVLIQVNSIGISINSRIRLALKMLLQSLLLAAVMMLVLPRLNPLWTVPLQSGEALVGVSDSMSPGDFDQLIRSNELALRITFEDQIIERSQMYWRGLVFDQFDGRRWQRSEPVGITATHHQGSHRFQADLRESFQRDSSGNVIHYEVLMEPTGQHWLYGLSPLLIESQTPHPLVYTQNQEVLQKQKIHQRVKYLAASRLGITRHSNNQPVKQLSIREREQYIALPVGSNPRTYDQAIIWRQQASSDQDYINNVLQFFRENFTYTLSPPKLSRHTSDEFLFSTQQGFCEHFSSSFVVLMRSVGIPSRIVVGYQGGQWSSDKTYLNVYQRDAHAWAEVWLESQGWVRVDPTAAVAEVRIERGVTAALPESERELVGRTSSVYQWLGQLQNQWQLIDYRWQQWVLDYDSQKQKTLLTDYLGNITPLKLAFLILLPLLVTASIVGFTLYRSHRIHNADEKKVYTTLQRKLSRLGIDSIKGESINAYCERAAKYLAQKPVSTESTNESMNKKILLINTIKNEFERLLYQPDSSVNTLSTIKKLLKRL